MVSYFSSRFTYDAQRDVVWKQICSFLQKYVSLNSTVLDIGAGYCNFINNIKAKKRIAVDLASDIEKFADKNVETYKTSCENLQNLKDDSVDVVFASNLLEHLKRSTVQKSLLEIKRVLKKDGLIIILQPNYKYAFKEYFDDYTHQSVFSHVSLCDYLISENFSIIKCFKKFLPFSMKSSFPKPTFLIKLYFKSPFKPFAKQMLVIARLKNKEIKKES